MVLHVIRPPISCLFCALTCEDYILISFRPVISSLGYVYPQVYEPWHLGVLKVSIMEGKGTNIHSVHCLFIFWAVTTLLTSSFCPHSLLKSTGNGLLLQSSVCSCSAAHPRACAICTFLIDSGLYRTMNFNPFAGVLMYATSVNKEAAWRRFPPPLWKWGARGLGTTGLDCPIQPLLLRWNNLS